MASRPPMTLRTTAGRVGASTDPGTDVAGEGLGARVTAATVT